MFNLCRLYLFQTYIFNNMLIFHILFKKRVKMSFEKLGLIKPLLGAIKELGYKHPTTIQKRAIPLVLAKSDIFATAQTGFNTTSSLI